MELKWRTYDVVTVPAGREVLKSTLLPGGVRVYMKECWEVPSHGERRLAAKWYSATRDFAAVEATVEDLVKHMAAGDERLKQMLTDFWTGAPVQMHTDGAPDIQTNL